MLLAAITATVGIGAAPASPHVRARAASFTHGFDVSWPQCAGSLARHMPPRRTRFVILGLTDGSGHTLNPCLGSQLRWARRSGVRVGAYLVPSFPTRSQRRVAWRGPLGHCGSLRCRARNDGASQALEAVRTMRGARMHAPMVWLDVEFRSFRPWAHRHSLNAAVLRGMVAELQKMHERYGVYSTSYMWHAIVGRYRLNVPNWLPVGYARIRAARRMCRHTASGGRTWLVQYTRSLDSDLTCPVLDPLPGRRNGLWPFRQLTLHLLSQGSAVKAVQAFLGQPRTGSYDAVTTVAVSTWQLQKGLPITGAIAPRDWRAMGAYRTRGGHGFLLNRIAGRP